jgi:hypothetical protein
MLWRNRTGKQVATIMGWLASLGLVHRFHKTGHLRGIHSDSIAL